jgi:D-alanine transaminase
MPIMNLCYLNGEFLPRSEARISPMDRGFLFGDGAYEVIPVYARRPFRLEQHLQRLAATLSAIRLPNPFAVAGWAGIVTALVARHPSWPDQSIYLQVTRGVAAVRNHAFPTPIEPTVFMTSDALVPPAAELVARGVSVVSAADFRWLRCDLKTISLLANCLLRQQAVDHGSAETILFRDGFLTEGAASNIFVVRDGVLLAPPKSQEARDADELWMTSSSKEVLAVTHLDGRPVGAGVPGPLARQMYDWYQQFKHLEQPL